MNETIRKKLKIEEEKTPYSLQEYGNTSSASIPLTLVTELQNQVNCAAFYPCFAYTGGNA